MLIPAQNGFTFRERDSPGAMVYNCRVDCRPSNPRAVLVGMKVSSVRPHSEQELWSSRPVVFPQLRQNNP